MKFGQGKSRFSRFMVMVMITLQTGYGAPLCYGAGQPTIPGYYGKDVSNLTPPSVNALPVVSHVVQNATVSQVRDNELLVNQSEDHAIIDWESFDIGADAHTRFDQQGNAAWSVLNRIHDENPSQIYGSLTADGTVYLINPNGMLFGEGSTINVHSLVAASLNTDQDDFINDTMTFSTLGDLTATQENPLVINRGSIETDTGGSVYLLSAHVVNSGTITAPLGRIVLAAGTEAAFSQEISTGNSSLTNKVTVTSDTASDTSSGNVVQNEAEGQLLSNMGNIELYGSTINQQGLVQTVTAIKKEGNIILTATGNIITGETSKTQNLISDSDEEVDRSFIFKQGNITLTSGGTIDHQGTITNPAGRDILTAKDRIYLADGSSIDVSGVTADLEAQDSVVTATLNSVELKDEQHQKDGILRGEDISFVGYEGSSIGDIGNYLEKDSMTAAEAAVNGGLITLTATDGDIIVRDGASLDFSGGSTYYESGYVDTTWLSSGNRAYSISDAPKAIAYDKILSSYEKTYARYGITETVTGVYTGGAVPVKSLIKDYYTGADAGGLTMNGATIVLDGSIDGSTMPGFYQTEEGELEDEFGNEYVIGYSQPAGGSLTIGNGDTSQIVVRDNKECLPDYFGVDSDLAEIGFLESDYADDLSLYKTLFSSETLSRSGLSILKMSAQTSIDIEEAASVTLEANGLSEGGTGAKFYAEARTINVNGDITVPSGTVILRTVTISTDEEKLDYISSERLGPEHIYVGENAVISVAGEAVDNSLSLSSGKVYETGLVDGGEIILSEKTLRNKSLSGDGVILRKGSVLDVSGGYEIGLDGSVEGGDAGTITLEGANLILDGDLYAYSLEGQLGGTIELFAEKVTVAETDTRETLGDNFDEGNFYEDLNLSQGLILDDNRLDNTGASHLVLKSFSSLTIENDVYLGVSTMKMVSPLSGVPSTDVAMDQRAQRNFVWVSDDEIGENSIKLYAGKIGDFYHDDYSVSFYDDTSLVSIDQGSQLHTGPTGSITVGGPGIEVNGILDAPAGSISLTTTTDVDGMSLLLGSGARLLAQGYLMPDKGTLTDDGSVSYTPLDGGDISLTAAGLLDIQNGATMDVSCPQSTSRIMQGEDGQTATTIVAGNPGSIALSFKEANLSTLTDTLAAENAGLAGLTGGTLSIMKIDTTEGLDLSEGMINDYLGSGFDALFLGSWHSLTFTDSVHVDVGRSLTLDAPEINASGVDGQTVSLMAHDITLKNSVILDNKTDRMTLSDASTLTVTSGGYLTIDGSMDISGFGIVDLDASKDLILKDRNYHKPMVQADYDFFGELNVEGDLTLSSARIYPTTQTDYTIHSDGKLTTVKVDDPDAGAIYSAGGRLVLEAGDIEHGGVLAAPLGEIVLCGTDHGDGAYDNANGITLLPGSEISVSGDVAVKYGQYDEDSMIWTLGDHEGSANDYQKFAGFSERRIVIQGETVNSEEGSVLDVSGGGSIFTYLFRPALEGTVDPLTAENTYVLMPVSDISLPGERIHLSGTDGSQAGDYVIVGEDYAFAQGAVVVKDLGLATALSGKMTDDQGYPVVVGYASALGQDGYSPAAHAYVVRNADDVRTEGSYSYAEQAADDAGSLSIQASTNLVNALLYGAGNGSGSGGTIDLSGTRVIIGQTVAEFDDSFDFTDTLYVNTDSLSGSGFTDLTLGNSDTTESVTLTAGSGIRVENLYLNARDRITVESGASIDTGHDETGAIGLLTPQGRLVLEEGSLIQAGEQLTLSGSSMDIQGAIGVDKGTLTVQSDAIAMVADGSENGLGVTGLTIDEGLWAQIRGLSKLEFESRTRITVDGGLTLDSGNTLTLDGETIPVGVQSLVLDTASLSVLAGSGEDEKEGKIIADTLVLRNSGDKDAFADDSSAAASGAVLSLEGSQSLTIEFKPRGESDDETGVSRQIALAGMETTHIQSDGAITLAGQGTLAVGEGDLELKAQVVTGGLSRSTNEDGDEVYKTPDVRVSLADGDLGISSNGDYDGNIDLMGGSLAFEALTINHGGSIVLPSGHVYLEATGSGDTDGITLEDKSLINVSGTDKSFAGSIALVSDHGKITTESGSNMDVSSGGAGDAGTVMISSLDEEVSLAGTILAEGGGGTFVLDVLKAEDVATLLSLMTGLDGTVYVRSRTGNMDVTSDITAHDLTLVADNGAITVSSTGIIDASGETGGGEISLNAGNDVVLESGSVLNASASGGDGGHVDLSSRTGKIQFNNGAEIDVSGSGTHDNGSVSFRADRVGDDNVAMDLNGTIKGAASVTVEARKKYTYDTIDSGVIATLKTETQDYLGRVTTNLTQETILTGLTLADKSGQNLSDADEAALFFYTPGLEIQSEDDLVLSSSLDLNTFGTQAGTLTLRANDDLTLTKSLLSHPTLRDELSSGGNPDSWSLNLVAGADFLSADGLALKDEGDSGKLTVADGAMVYTESGALRFASSQDTELGTGVGQTYSVKNAMYCSMATFDGDITGQVGGNLTLTAGAIQTGTGNITLDTGGDISLKSKNNRRASIRTTGEAPSEISAEYPGIASRYDLTWLYENGGDITVKAGGDIYGIPVSGAWDNTREVYRFSTENNQVIWSARYSADSSTTQGATQGIVTMGGGDVTLLAEGNITCQSGVFGNGDLTVQADGDLNGRFLVNSGSGDLFTAGSFGTLSILPEQTLELLSGNMDLYAQGAISLGTVLSPSMSNFYSYEKNIWNPGYTSESSASLETGFGDISLTGDSSYLQKEVQDYLPPSFAIISKKDIHIGGTLTLLPSATGNLVLDAKGSIDGEKESGGSNILTMADCDPLSVYSVWNNLTVGEVRVLKNLIGSFSRPSTSSVLLHESDTQPALIHAGENIENLKLTIPKKAEITAGEDIVELVYWGQNLNEDDVTVIAAGHDIVFSSQLTIQKNMNNAIELAGPGTLAVLAGNAISLGTSTGIVTTGNRDNNRLPNGGSDVVVVSGYDNPYALDNLSEEVISFFDILRNEGKDYTDALGVDNDETQEHLDAATTLLEDVFGEAYVDREDEADIRAEETYVSEKGNINMIRSQITTKSGGDINLIAAGDINVGETAIKTKQDDSTGINVQSDGDIRLFAVGDVNVNEARLMAWYGGDITLWTDAGDINAGIGSRSEVSPGTVSYKINPDTGEIEKTIIPSAVGSGIRAMTYDLDGIEGPKKKPVLGDVYLFAPSGIIDAGEAGIAGNTVYLGARTVLNVQNISFSQGAVGVPMGAESSVNLGAITGAGSVGAGNQMADSAAALAAVNKEFENSADKMGETFLPTWLRVEFMGFDVDDRGL